MDKQQTCRDCGNTFECSKRRFYCDTCGGDSARSFRKRKNKNPELKRRWWATAKQNKCQQCARKLTGKQRIFCGKFCAKAFQLGCSVTPESYTEAFRACEGKCEICGRKQRKKLAIDHNHTTKEFRGLLCTSCNVGIGMFKDSQELLELAKQYIKKGS